MQNRSLAGAGALMMLALPLGACGDDGPSREAFEAEVKQICQASGERHAEVAPDFDFASFDPATSDLNTIVPVIEGHLAIGAETLDRLEGVEGPAEDEEKLSEFMAAAERIHETGRAEIEAAKRGDRDGFVELTSKEEALQGELSKDPIFEGC